jgi:DNA-binding transcriptional MerR regulator
MSSALASAVPARAKSPEAFRTISEVSMELDVPQHVLRFWETRFAQIRPVKRAGGRRFYRPDDVALLRGIRSLLYSDGYTIKGVQKVLRDKGWRFVAEIGRGASGLVPWNDLEGAVADDAPVPAAPEERLHPNPAVAALMRAHADAAETVAMEEHKRVRLELLLAELLVLRDRLRAARAAG